MKKIEQQGKKVSYKLLDDNPSEEDKFGAHARIAKAIAALIKNNDGGKTIALLGEWGSGKSTTIKLLEGNLDKNYKIFTYDAWVHSGDHLRKAFLNEFIDALIENTWLFDREPDEWKNEKLKLAQKLVITYENHEPDYSPQGKTLVPLIFALPIVTVIFNNLIEGYIKDAYFFTPWSPVLHVITLLLFICMIFPFVYVIYHLVSKKGVGAKVLYPIGTKSTHTGKTTSLMQPEATTIEFQEVFKKVAERALEDKDKKLIIVIDNLDRVDKEEANNIWALLRGFIDNPSYKRHKEGKNWLNKLWVVVPLADTKKQDIPNDGEDSGTLKSKVDEQFLEKIFQVRFHLPPPVQSDWRKHLNYLLEKSFPSEKPNQWKLILRLYESFIFEATPQKSLPTPRELTLFINDLIVLALQWREHFDLASCAAYILSLKVVKNDMLKNLRAGKIPTNSVKRILKEDPTVKFAAFYFNIEDTKKAHTVLLEPVIEQALKNKHSASLITMIKNNPNLNYLLENVIDSSLPNWALDQPESFFNALITVAELGEVQTTEEVYLLSPDIKEMLVDRTTHALKNSFKAFPLLVKNSVEAVEKIAKIQSEINLTDTVVDSVRQLNKLSSNESGLFYPKLDNEDEKVEWIKKLHELYVNKEFKAEFDKFDTNSIILPIPIEGWATICKSFSEDKGFLRIIYPEKGESIIPESLVKAINDSKYEIKHFYILDREFENDSYEYLIDDLVLAAEASISSGRVDTSNENLIEDLILFRANSILIDSLLLTSNEKGHLGHIFFEAHRTGQTKLLPTLLLAILIKNPQLLQHQGLSYSVHGIQTITTMIQQPANHPELFDGLIGQIEFTNEYRVLIDLALKNLNSRILLQYLLPKVKDQKLVYEKFDLKQLPVELGEYIKRAYPEDKTEIFQKVVDYFIDEKELIKHLMKNETDLDISDVKFYCYVLLNKKGKEKKLIKKLIKILKSLDEETWLTKIRTFTWVFYLAILIVKTGSKVDLSLPLRQALHRLMKETEANVIPTEVTALNMKDLQRALSDTQLKNFAEDVYEFSAQPERKLTESFWRLFGDTLADATLFLGNKGRPIRRLFKPIILNRDLEGMKWILDLLRTNKLSAFDDDKLSKKDIKATLNNLLTDVKEEDDIYPYIKDLLSLLNKR